MKIFFDTEFTGLCKNSDLISIGLVAEDGSEFYAEFTDYDLNKCTDKTWIEQNVINNLINEQDAKNIQNYIKDSSNNIKLALKKWLSQFDEVDLVSDVCHYDFVLFIDLFGTAFDIPENVCPACYDINQDISKFLDLSICDAFNYNRERLLEEFGQQIDGQKHNSLYDAKVIKALYNLMH